jgi:hypothetical protein
MEVKKLKNRIVIGKIDRKTRLMTLYSADYFTFFDLLTGDILHVFYEENKPSKVFPLPNIASIPFFGGILPIKYQKIIDKMRDRKQEVKRNINSMVDKIIAISSKNREKVKLVFDTLLSEKGDPLLFKKITNLNIK